MIFIPMCLWMACGMLLVGGIHSTGDAASGCFFGSVATFVLGLIMAHIDWNEPSDDPPATEGE